MLEEVRAILAETLSLGKRAEALRSETALLGSIPELDSMAVVSLIIAVEEHYGFTVDDDEIDADAFATVGTLMSFIDKKLNA